MCFKANLIKRFKCAFVTLCLGDTRKRQRELNVTHHALMRNKVIGLEYKTNAVVSIGIPVSLFELLGRNTVYQQVSRIKAIKTTNNIEHSSLTRARRTKDCYKLVIPKRNGNVIHCSLFKSTSVVTL